MPNGMEWNGMEWNGMEWNGIMESWNHGIMESWNHGIMEQKVLVHTQTRAQYLPDT